MRITTTTTTTQRKKQQKTHHHSNHRKTFKKPLNCHPSLLYSKHKHKRVLDHSCLTSEALELLKNTYNNKNPGNPIISNDPKEIWDHLHHKIPHCDQESCWIQNIPDISLQNKLKNELFSPLQPPEWKKNKNAWLSNFDIDKVLKQYVNAYYDENTKIKSFISLGPTPIDFDKKKTNGKCVWEEICKLSLSTEYNKGVRKIGLIYNLDTHRGYGTHWVSMFIDMAEEKPFIFYFNSTSQRMPKQIKDLVDRLQKQWVDFKGTEFEVYKNTRIKHQRTNNECGMYSLFFVITCLTRKTDLVPNKDLSVSDLVELFATKHRIDDKYVAKFREIYFTS
jgi:hypothetical protein